VNPRRLGWAAIAAAGIALEAAALRDDYRNHRPTSEGYTLTGTMASVFHTDTEVGRAAFRISWRELSRWFVAHVNEDWS
jgi:hypothetical protein